MNISGLYIYPIKSCAGVALSSMRLDELGAAYDRRYMLVDGQGGFVSQRRYASLVHIAVQPHDSGWQIMLPDQSARILPFVGSTQLASTVTVWRDTFAAYDQGDEWADFFSGFLAAKVRLVYADMAVARQIDRNYCQQERRVGFVDGFPLLIANENSLQVLNDGLAISIGIERFRPNIVISGAPAFAENRWQKLRSGSIGLSVVKPCSRCVIPTINPRTARKEKAVWQMLEQHCQGADGQVYFGQNVIHDSNGELHLGESITVLSEE